MWREFADAFVGADQVILTDVCGFHEQPIPGVTGHLILNAVLDAHPELPVAYFPHRAELVELGPRATRARATSCSPWAAATSRRSPTSCSPATPRARGGGVIVTDARAASLADELAAALEPSLPGRVERDAPLAGLTTYRVGGPAAVLVRAAARRRPRGRRLRAASPPAAAADPRARLEPARRRRRLPRARAAARRRVRGDHRRARDSVRAGGAVGAAGARRAGRGGRARPGWSSTSASPAPSGVRCG